LGVVRPMYAYFAEFKYKFIKPRGEILGRFEGERRNFVEAIFNNTNMKKVWGDPDFEALFANYASDRGRVITALEYLQETQCIELESKRMTEVFSVNEQALADSGLVQKLHQYFVDKEHKEIKRIAALIRFFELDKCLSYNLSQYFDDQQAPQQCGHCSVCRGQVAKLAYSQQQNWPTDETLSQVLAELKNHLAAKVAGPLSDELLCRFLAGLSVPIFARNKTRQLAGFALCENFRYADIRSKVQNL
jgi:ATP-dependent DNA helicase RecQ